VEYNINAELLGVVKNYPSAGFKQWEQ